MKKFREIDFPSFVRKVCPECGGPSNRNTWVWKCEKCGLAWDTNGEHIGSDGYRFAYRKSGEHWVEVPKNTMMVWRERQEV